MRSLKTFTPEELKLLRANPYVKSATSKMVRFTVSFKEEFWRKYNEEHKSSQKIMEELSLSAETPIHSDQGCHYTSYAFIDIVNDNELRRSMSRKANCWDNAPQESFFGHMKDEIDVSGCLTHKQLCDIIHDWIDYYNNERYQWDLAILSPNEYFQYISTGIYPLGGSAPEPPEFIAFISKEDRKKDGA